ncbi:MAG: PilZ domain-containing protein, partial [Myxococcota bacterium]
DAKIKEYLGTPPKPVQRRSGSFPKPGERTPTPPAAAAEPAPVASSWPQEVQKLADTSFEWATEFVEKPGAPRWGSAAPPTPRRTTTRQRTMMLRAVDYFVPTARPVARLEAAVESGAAFLEAYFPNGHLGGLTVAAGPHALSPGHVVELAVALDGPVLVSTLLKGRVAFERGGEGKRVGVEFMPNEGQTVDRLLATARSGMPGVRRKQRVSTAVAVTVMHPGGSLEVPASLSESGAFLHSAKLLPVGEPVMARIQPPRGLPVIQLRSYVLWQRQGGEPGMGISFETASAPQREALHDVVRRLLES